MKTRAVTDWPTRKPRVRPGKLEDDRHGAALRVDQGAEGHQAGAVLRRHLENRLETLHPEPGPLGLADLPDVRLGDPRLEPQPLRVHEVEEAVALFDESAWGDLDAGNHPRDRCPHRYPRRLALRRALDLRQTLARGGKLGVRHLLGAARLQDLPVRDGALLPQRVQAFPLLAGEVPGGRGPGDPKFQTGQVRLAAELGHQIGDDLARLDAHSRVRETPGRGSQMAVNGGGDVGLAVCARPQQSRRRYRSAQQALRGDGGAEIRAPLLFFQ